MLRMETVVTTSQTLQDSHSLEEEEGEILEDGEIDDEDTNDKSENNPPESLQTADSSSYVVEEVVEQVYDEEEDAASGDDEEKKKHRKRSHHRRRRKKHDDRRSEEKSKHRKRKGEDASDGGGSPPSKKKKKRKKHSKDKKDRESTSPENDSQTQYESKRLSESPPLPSEQTLYGYESYNTMNTYNDSNNYTSTFESSAAYTDTINSATHSYGAETYQQEADYSSGSDSYYSDFESHLKQYQSYKQNKDTTNDPENNNKISGDEDDIYYSVGYDAEKRRGRNRSNDDVRPNRRPSHRMRSGQNGAYDEKRRSSRRESRSVAQRDDQPVCRYFKEGHCGKGDKCIYSHQLGNRRNKDGSIKKIPELCPHYVNGYCQLGDKCNYMHEEYPCKYFHTGTQCYNGENCRFSHDPATDLTRDIIKQFQDAFNTIDDTKEIEALEKVGIKPLQKPPPGMGLLPTPPSTMSLMPSTQIPQMPMKRPKGKIPSLFDINVQPTADLQQKIDANAVPCLQMMDDGGDSEEGPSQTPMPMPAPMFDPNHGGGGLLPLPALGTGMLRPPIIPNFPPPNFIGAPQGPPPQMMMPVPPVTGLVPPSVLPPGSATPPWIQRQKALLQQQQEEAKEFYDKFYAKSSEKQATPSLQSETKSDENEKPKQETIATSRKKTEDNLMSSAHHDENDEAENGEDDHKEDVIRMDDDEIMKDSAVKAPDFLPAKQKALFMRIHQKRTLSNETETAPGPDSGGGKDISADNWTYSSDEDDTALSSGQRVSNNNTASSESVQSIIKMISNKKADSDATVDTNLLSKVATVISLPATVSGLSHSNRMTYSSNSQSSGKGMMSPPRQPHHRSERKSSNVEASPRHNPLRRRLSTSELNKEPVTIPLVVKQSADSMHTSHPDPRITLSRLFGKTKSEFRGPLPGFGKDVMMPGSGKMTGLKITLSSHGSSSEHSSGEKRSDPRLSHRQRPGDPRIKSKPNDPRLRMRASSLATKTSPPRSPMSSQVKTSIPTKPTALLTKPPSSIIPSLPELNLDLAAIQDHKKKSPKQSESPVSTKIADPLAGLPKLMRGNVRPASNNHMVSSSSPTSKQPTTPTIAPYDPRYITAGVAATTTTAQSSSPAPYDPRVISSQMSNVPPLYDPRAANKDVKKRATQLPKLTPAPGYAAKVQESNGSSHVLPSGEQEDF